jgi:mono/diheme cytochrome c family protein
MRMSFSYAVVMAVGLGVAAVAASAAAPEAPVPVVEERATLQAADKGKEVYAANKCQMCHMIDGVGNKRAPLDGVGAKLSKDDLRKWILTPSEMNPKVKKPSYAKIAKDDLDALVEYLSTLK